MLPVCVCVSGTEVGQFDISTSYHIRNIYIQTYVNFPPPLRVCVSAQIFVLDCVCVCVCLFHSLADSMCIILKTLHKAQGAARASQEGGPKKYAMKNAGQHFAIIKQSC